MAKCPLCGAENGPETLFCTSCGKKMQHETSQECPKCGAKIGEGEMFCTACGAQMREYEKSKKNSAETAAILSLIPGLGHLYLGKRKKALAFASLVITKVFSICLGILIALVMLMSSGNGQILGELGKAIGNIPSALAQAPTDIPILFIIGIIFYGLILLPYPIYAVVAMIDAYKLAKNENYHNRIMAAVLSFLNPGSGQIYNGDIAKGIALLIGAYIIGGIMELLGLKFGFFGLVISFILAQIIVLAITVEAYMSAGTK